jgi:hypothetical protein
MSQKTTADAAPAAGQKAKYGLPTIEMIQVISSPKIIDTVNLNRTGFIGGLFLREDGAHVPKEPVRPGTA